MLTIEKHGFSWESWQSSLVGRSQSFDDELGKVAGQAGWGYVALVPSPSIHEYAIPL